MRRISGYSSIVILLLAFALRVYHLDFQASLSDDALGLTLARHNPLSLFSITATEPFPPSFYVTLSLWAKIAGTSEFAGRFYSLVFSVLAVAVMMVAGRRLLGSAGGPLAGLLLAVNPFDIYFAQEVRMYAMVTLFSLASSVLAFELLFRRSKPWVGYAVVSLLAAMTHAFALFVLFGQDLAALVAGPRAWRWLRAWAACQLAVVAAFAVWVALVAGKLQGYRNGLVRSLPLPTMFWRTVTAYALGFTPAAGLAGALPAILAVLALLGLIWLLVRQPLASNHAFLFLLCYLAVPFFAVWAISLVRPIFYERYMVVALPPFLLFAAAGIVALDGGFVRLAAPARRTLAARRRWWRHAFPALAAAGLLLTAIPSASHLSRYYRTPVYATSAEMRALAAFVSSVRNPIVITNVARGDPLYGYYLPPSVAIASTLDMSSADQDLARLARQHSTVWFLPFGESDRQRQAVGWLSAHAFPAGSRWFGNAQVLAFAAGSSPSPPDVKPLLSPVEFGGRIALIGLQAPASVAAGAPVDVTLAWRAERQPEKDYSVFLHLLAASGSTASQHDGWPAAGARPTSSWRPGETIQDRHGLLTARSLAPGRYRLEVGLYDASGQRLALADGRTSAIVGDVEVLGGSQ